MVVDVLPNETPVCVLAVPKEKPPKEVVVAADVLAGNRPTAGAC